MKSDLVIFGVVFLLQEIPASPFRVKVDPSHDASKVKAEGPGLNKTGESWVHVVWPVVDHEELLQGGHSLAEHCWDVAAGWGVRQLETMPFLWHFS